MAIWGQSNGQGIVLSHYSDHVNMGFSSGSHIWPRSNGAQACVWYRRSDGNCRIDRNAVVGAWGSGTMNGYLIWSLGGRTGGSWPLVNCQISTFVLLKRTPTDEDLANWWAYTGYA